MTGIGRIGAFGITDCGKMVCQREPCLRKVGFERNRTTQRDDRLLAASGTTQGEPQFQLSHGPIGLLRSEWPENFQRLFGIAAGGTGSAKQQQCHGMVFDDFQYFRCLFAGTRRIGRE